MLPFYLSQDRHSRVSVYPAKGCPRARNDAVIQDSTLLGSRMEVFANNRWMVPFVSSFLNNSEKEKVNIIACVAKCRMHGISCCIDSIDTGRTLLTSYGFHSLKCLYRARKHTGMTCMAVTLATIRRDHARH